MRRSSFRRPQIERKPVVLTRIAPQDRRGVMAPVGGAVVAVPKVTTYRSEKHLARVRQIPCVRCGKEGESQAAHMNLGKSLAKKASDAAVGSLCPICHHWLDQSGAMTKEERRAFEWEMVARTYIALMERGMLG